MTNPTTPEQSTHQTQMLDAMKHLDRAFNGDRPDGAEPGSAWRRIGLCLLSFEYGDQTSGLANYISNGASRHDMITFLRETADRFERGETQDVKPGPEHALDPDEPQAPYEPPPEATMNVFAHSEIDPAALDLFERAKQGALVATAWEGFREFVVGDQEFNFRQLSDLRGTFFAGAHTMFEFLSSTAGMVDEEALQVMAGVDRELREFASMMMAVAEREEGGGSLN